MFFHRPKAIYDGRPNTNHFINFTQGGLPLCLIRSIWPFGKRIETLLLLNEQELNYAMLSRIYNRSARHFVSHMHIPTITARA